MLSKRLSTCLTYLPPVRVLYDVGTDHAYLAIDAVRQGIVTKVYAVDNKKGPLTSAKNAIKAAGLTDKVFPVLSDGIRDLAPDADGIVIAGLGGKTIHKILDGQDYKNLKRFVLQPNNNAHMVRMLTTTNSLKIVDETLVLEDGIIYPVIVLENGSQSLDEKDIQFGPVLRRHASPLFETMLKSDITHIESIITTMPAHIDKTPHQTQLALMKEVLDDYTRRH